MSVELSKIEEIPNDPLSITKYFNDKGNVNDVVFVVIDLELNNGNDCEFYVDLPYNLYIHNNRLYNRQEVSYMYKCELLMYIYKEVKHRVSNCSFDVKEFNIKIIINGVSYVITNNMIKEYVNDVIKTHDELTSLRNIYKI